MTYYDLNKRTPEQEANDTAAYEKRREIERAEAAAHHAETIKLIEEICGELNKGRVAGEKDWTIRTFDPAEYIDRLPELVHTDGRGIHFSDGHVWRERKKKLGISGSWPMFDNQYITPSLVGADHPGIEVSRDRGAAVIAREITRRFLPAYTEVWLKCKARVNTTIAHEDKTRENYQELCRVLGTNPDKVTRHGVRDTNISVYNYFHGAGYGDISVSGDSVTFTLHSVDIKTALEIAETISAIHDDSPFGAYGTRRRAE